MPGRPHAPSERRAILRVHQAEFAAEGIETTTLFGSFARAEATAVSDVDLAIRTRVGFSSGGLRHFGRLESLRQ